MEYSAPNFVDLHLHVIFWKILYLIVLLFITTLQQNGFPVQNLIKVINKYEYNKRLSFLKFKLTDKLFTFLTN